MEDQQFLVNRNELSDCRWASVGSADPAQLAADQVLLRVDEFAFTANNVTYAVAGEMMGYWQFFPAPDGWGRIPVWGFATVVASQHPDVAEGERLYGYLPMGSHLVITAGQVSASGLVDVSEHRAALPPVYNQLQRVATAPDAEADALQMLYRPLFMTSWLLDDFLAVNDRFGAEQVLLTSASSKTSIGLAHCLHRRGDVHVVGLTSPSNESFVRSLGCYDDVVGYDAVAALDRGKPAVVVDMAGNGGTLAAIHAHFDDQLKYSCLVGATHWTARSGAQQLAGPQPILFFAPDHIRDRGQEWGPGGLEQRFGEAWDTFTGQVGDWIQVERAGGPEAVQQVYGRVLAGDAPPNLGFILAVS